MSNHPRRSESPFRLKQRMLQVLSPSPSPVSVRVQPYNHDIILHPPKFLQTPLDVNIKIVVAPFQNHGSHQNTPLKRPSFFHSDPQTSSSVPIVPHNNAYQRVLNNRIEQNIAQNNNPIPSIPVQTPGMTPLQVHQSSSQKIQPTTNIDHSVKLDSHSYKESDLINMYHLQAVSQFNQPPTPANSNLSNDGTIIDRINITDRSSLYQTVAPNTCSINNIIYSSLKGSDMIPNALAPSSNAEAVFCSARSSGSQERGRSQVKLSLSKNILTKSSHSPAPMNQDTIRGASLNSRPQSLIIDNRISVIDSYKVPVAPIKEISNSKRDDAESYRYSRVVNPLHDSKRWSVVSSASSNQGGGKQRQKSRAAKNMLAQRESINH